MTCRIILRDTTRKIEQRCKVLKIQTPLAVRRFLDRLVDHSDVSNKLARDLHGKEDSELTPEQQAAIHRMHNELPGWNPATGSTYQKAGMDFAQAHNLLLASYSEQSDRRLPQELRAALNDLSPCLEHDLDDSAKKAGETKTP